ncbi:MAG: AmmeMemoRadiSam system radical SAM enzyme, partial [Acidobacteria bacterium]|nr:AmmeMemoRadiSam system radical SAM enzyme [Acidobacteriota bacterium]
MQSTDGGNVDRDQIEPGVVRGSWWHALDDGRVQCDLCPRFCRLRDGQKAFCYVREARGGEVVLASYGRASGFCIAPIEKKPLSHFYPGSSVLSFGTAGCNLGCRFCQNWDISKAREDHALSAAATPAGVAAAAAGAGRTSVAFTYNDTIIFAEYAIDCAKAARAHGVRSVAVSSGYVTPAARGDLFAHMDAANIDLKAFAETFYHRICFAHLEPVLDTLEWLPPETAGWLEETTPLLPPHKHPPPHGEPPLGP